MRYNFLIVFKLSNVTKGGATVFPFLRIYVPPKQGSVVLWDNLSTSGHKGKKQLNYILNLLIGILWKFL